MVFIPEGEDACVECHRLACAHDAGAVRAPWIYTDRLRDWHEAGHPADWVEG